MSLIKSKFIAINDGCFITDTFTTRGGVYLKNPPLGAAKQKYFFAEPATKGGQCIPLGHSQQEALHAEWGASVLIIVAFIIHMFRMASLPLRGG